MPSFNLTVVIPAELEPVASVLERVADEPLVLRGGDEHLDGVLAELLRHLAELEAYHAAHDLAGECGRRDTRFPTIRAELARAERALNAWEALESNEEKETSTT